MAAQHNTKSSSSFLLHFFSWLILFFRLRHKTFRRALLQITNNFSAIFTIEMNVDVGVGVCLWVWCYESVFK